MSKIVDLIAADGKGQKPSIRQRKLKAKFGLRKTKRMIGLDNLANRLGYKLVPGTSIAFRHAVSVDFIKQDIHIETSSIPRVKKMTFTEACKISQELSDSREDRLMRANFDGPE
ncbi:hypothetical protein NUG39_04280 [Citrobacter youngae]|uniref:hypothetical protein n=1 Tax=Citrobacter youngae TaxID=133448 RepID=UPI0020702D2B|nr:hypothetical protein [Citrobacter youngae]UUX55264.1 hypothetical protein NUG39_04280 [Citrobacter youngae]DAJ72037.1 MAG TPA: hypothetical protein [Caudoviricetes sp.]